MDNFRVFEPIISFQAEAHAQFAQHLYSKRPERGGQSAICIGQCHIHADDYRGSDPINACPDPDLARFQPKSALRRRVRWRQKQKTV